MIPYYIVFLISGFLCCLAEINVRNEKQTYKKKESRSEKSTKNVSTLLKKKKIYLKNIVIKINKLKIYQVLLVLSVIVVVFLAGARDYSVGTDVKVYGNSLFFYAKQYRPFSVYVERFSHIEPLYLIMTYFSSLIADEPHILYFFTGFIIYGSLMIAFYKQKESFPLTLTWLAFLFLLYGDTYNAMRQCIAIAIGMWAFSFVLQGNYKKFIIGVIIASLFHNTAIMFIPIYLIYGILQKNNKLYMKILLIIAVMGGILFFNEILSLLMQIGILNSKMERYYIAESTGLSVFAILIRLPFLLLIILQKKAFTNGNKMSCSPLKNENITDFYIILLVLEMIAVEMNAFVASLYRISLYFVPFRCMAYARICVVQKRENKIILVVCLILYLLIVFVYQNQIKGNNDIYPYIFGL